MSTGDQRHGRTVVDVDDPILVTGANGFIGSCVVEALLARGFRNLRCFVRSNRNVERLRSIIAASPSAHVEIVEGNLTSSGDATTAAKGVRLVYHLAAGISEKTAQACLRNTVDTTRNLLEALAAEATLTRFVNVSSLAVYSNFQLERGSLLDESCPLETDHDSRSEPYAYAKLKQEELVQEYAARHKWTYVILRPGAVFGPGKAEITGRVGLRAFGIFVDLGSRNRIPFTHVSNCAEAIVLAGLTEGADDQVFNVIDDQLPTGREFIAAYQRHVGALHKVSVPYPIFYLLCHLWERCAGWSMGLMAPAFNRRKCAAYWKGNLYSNQKLKTVTGWEPLISFDQASPEYFGYLRNYRSS